MNKYTEAWEFYQCKEP